MLPLQRILCPTDFSEPSYRAIKTAVELAEHFYARLCLVHVVPPAPVFLRTPGGRTLFSATQYENQLSEYGHQMIKRTAKERVPGSIQTDVVVLSGMPAQQILQAARERETDLIVIATQGATGWQRVRLGSVAWRVVRLATCPVMLVRGPEGIVRT